MRNPYVVLQVHSLADLDVIRAAHRARLTKSAGDRELVKELNQALELLSDPERRMKFDEQLKPSVGSTVGSYRIVRAIAEGGFGTTYEAEHLITGGRACIKHCLKVSDEYNDVLIREAMALWNLAHFSLPAMRDVVRMDDGSLALVMSYIDALTVEQVVKKVGRLRGEDVAWITDRALNALLYLHHYGVIDGDIKPQNVMIQHLKQHVYLIDFGLANSCPTATTKVGGYTKYFAPPEQVASALDRERGGDGKPLLPAADFFSLGALMLYMLGGDVDAVVRRVAPSTVPAPMRHFIDDLMERDPLQRPKGNVFALFKQVQKDSFGYVAGERKIEPIPGL